MALTYDDISSKTNKFIVPRLVDNVYKSSPVLTRLRTNNMERFEGGTTIRHPIMYAELRGGAFTRGGTFDISYVQTDTARLKGLGHCSVIPRDALFGFGLSWASSLWDTTASDMGLSEQLAYVAGIIDGEGSFNISRTENCFQSSLVVRMKNKRCLDRVLGVLGGSLQPDSQDGLWCFSIRSSSQVSKACSRLFPFLVGKKDQAELAVQYAECVDGPHQGRKLSEEEFALRSAFSEKMVGLHVPSIDEGSDVGVKNEELVAYAAGLIDAEGSITIIKSGRGRLPAVLIQMTDTAPLYRVARVFGGHVHEETRRTKKGKVVYSFRLTSNNASEMCKAMLPYLIAKREQAEIAIQFQNNVNLWIRRLGFGNKNIPGDVRTKRDEMVLKIRSLNTSHKRAAAETNSEHPVKGEVIVRAFHD